MIRFRPITRDDLDWIVAQEREVQALRLAQLRETHGKVYDPALLMVAYDDAFDAQRTSRPTATEQPGCGAKAACLADPGRSDDGRGGD